MPAKRKEPKHGNKMPKQNKTKKPKQAKEPPFKPEEHDPPPMDG